MKGRAGEACRRVEDESESRAEAMGGGTFCVRKGVRRRTSVTRTREF